MEQGHLQQGHLELDKILRELGMMKYLSLLHQEEVTAGDLAHLTKEDLRQIGIPMGPAARITRYFSETF